MSQILICNNYLEVNLLKKISNLCFAALFFSGSHCLAAPTQDEVDAAKRTQALAEAEKATAEAKKAIAEAEVAEARAKLGTLDVSKLTPPTAEVKTLNVEANLLAYASLQKIAKNISDTINKHTTNKKVVLYSENELQFVQQVQSFSSNLESLNKDIQKLKMPRLTVDNPQCAAHETGGGGIGALGSVDLVAQVLSLFKTNKTLSGFDVTPDLFAFSAAVASELKKSNATVIYPSLFFPGIALNSPGKSVVEQNLDNIIVSSAQIDRFIVEITETKEKLKERKAADKKPSALCKIAYENDEKVLVDSENKAQILKDRAIKYVAVATTPDEKTGSTLLQSLIAAEAMRNVAAGSYVLQIKPISAGGTTLTKTTFFTSSFRFSGGAVAAYMLIDTNGTVLDSGVIGAYGGYIKADELSKGIISSSQPNK